MAEIFKFQKGEECCSTCQLVEEYFTYIMEADTADEVYELLHELVSHVQYDSYKEGYRDALVHDVESKLNYLQEIDQECDCEKCNGNN